MGTVCEPCAARCQWLHADELKREAERREIAAGERMSEETLDVVVTYQTMGEMFHAARDDILKAIQSIQDRNKRPGAILLPKITSCYGLPVRFASPPHDAPRPDTAICPACKVVSVTAGPRYKVGDLVDGDEFTGGVVTAVETEPICVVRWPPPPGYVQRLKESALSPHRPAPVVCTPDGARCEQWQKLIEPARIFVGQTQVNQGAFRVCPWCGGKLKEDA